jgi:hypothetical protein
MMTAQNDGSDIVPTLSVLIVSYNTRALTLRALETLFTCTRASLDVLVADNNSMDGSAEAIARAFPSVRLIRLDHNIGFAAANNTLAPLARSDLLLLLNPDTEVLEGSVDALLSFRAQHPHAGIWGGRTLFDDGSLNSSSCWRRQTVFSLFLQACGINSLFRFSVFFNPERVIVAPEDGCKKVEIVSGCFLLIERALWNQLNGFDSDFFMYGEDADLCLRAIRFGADPAVTGSATIIHHGGRSEFNRSGKLVKLIRAKRQLIDRHLSPPLRGIGRLLLEAWPWSRMLAHSVCVQLGLVTHVERADCWRAVWVQREWWRAASSGRSLDTQK